MGLNDLNPYLVLGIEVTATPQQIKLAYREMARKWHPDINHEPNAAEMMMRVNRAYEILTTTGYRPTSTPRQQPRPQPNPRRQSRNTEEYDDTEFWNGFTEKKPFGTPPYKIHPDGSVNYSEFDTRFFEGEFPKLTSVVLEFFVANPHFQPLYRMPVVRYFVTKDDPYTTLEIHVAIHGEIIKFEWLRTFPFRFQRVVSDNHDDLLVKLGINMVVDFVIQLPEFIEWNSKLPFRPEV